MASDRLRGNRDSKIVVLDSSAILMLFEFSINLEHELTGLIGKFRIVMPNSILKELQVLVQKGDGRTARSAKASLKLVQKYDVEDSKDLDGDNSVLFVAEKHNGIVVTNDKELKERAKKRKLHVVYLRGKGKLVLE